MASRSNPTRAAADLVRTLGLAVAFVVLFVVAGAPAQAHSGIQSYVYVSITEDSVEGRVEYPAQDLADVLGIELPSDPDDLLDAVVAEADLIRSYTDEHIEMGDGSLEWELSFQQDPGVLPAVGGYVLVPFTVERSFDGAPRTFEVDYDGILHDNPERDALLIIENDWGTARFDNEGDHLLGFSQGMTARTVQLEDVSTWQSMVGARGVGTTEVRTDADHLLFVVALLLPAGLVAAGASVRGAAPSVLQAVRRAVVVLGAFMASHSLVLWVVGLASIDVPSDLVRVLLLASLLAMAVFAVRPVAAREIPLVAVLGAVQGLGFGSAFVDRDLDGNGVPALVAFNVGIEVAVMVIAVLLFPLLLLLRRSLAAAALWGGAAVIAAYACASLVEQVIDIDLQSDWLAAQLRQWPRNLWLALLGWAVAGAVAWWSAQREHQGRSADPHDPSAEAADEREMVMP